MFDFINHLVGSKERKLLLLRKPQIKINGVKKQIHAFQIRQNFQCIVMYQKCKSMVVISIYNFKFLEVQGRKFPVINEDIKRFICKPWNLRGWKLRKRRPPLLLPPPSSYLPFPLLLFPSLLHWKPTHNLQSNYIFIILPFLFQDKNIISQNYW